MRELASEKVAAFFSQFKQQKFKKGEILIRADDDPFGIYFLIKGGVKQYAISLKGEESVVTLFKPGSYFPMSWAFHPVSNKYYYEAVSEVEVYRAPVNDVLEFVKNNNDVTLDLLTRVFSGLDALAERMVYLMSGSAQERLRLELIILAKRFGTKKIKNKKNYYVVEISEKDLAAQTGLARETVSRELQALKQDKSILADKSLLYIDMEKLHSDLLDIG